MNRANLVRLLLIVLLASVPPEPRAQQALDIIPLRYRTVEQVLPALQPLVEPGGTLSGSRGQLFLRASAANVAEIKRVLEAIDRPSRRLMILVRIDDAAESARRELGARGSISNSGSRVRITAEDSRAGATERVDQRVQVLDGGQAYIFAGQGFEVRPQLSGDRVLLDIATQRETPGPVPGSVQGQRILSTVSARLGEWVEIGGTGSADARDERVIGSTIGTSTSRAAQSRRVWVKVEEAK